MQAAIKTIIIDDHEIMVNSLYHLLKQKQELEIVGKYTTAQEALDEIEQKQPDIILSDFHMPVMNGIDLIQQIKKRNLPCKVIILTMANDYKTLTAIRLNGAEGIVEKNASIEELYTAIKEVSQGNQHFRNEETKQEKESQGRTLYAETAENQEIEVSITERELEVMKLISLEYNNAQIADRLFISERTVETHRKNIFKKLHINSALGLMRFMIKNRLL